MFNVKKYDNNYEVNAYGRVMQIPHVKYHIVFPQLIEMVIFCELYVKRLCIHIKIFMTVRKIATVDTEKHNLYFD